MKPNAAYCIRCFKCKGKESECTKSILEGDRDKYLTHCDASMNRSMRIWREKGGENELENKVSVQTSTPVMEKKKPMGTAAANASSAFATKVDAMRA